MHAAKIAALIALAASTALAACGGGVEGTYKLDKAEVKKSMEAEVAKLPADQQDLAKLGVALIDAMDMSMELQSGGKLKATTTAPSLGEGGPKTETKEGSWKMDGEAVVLTIDGKPEKCAKDGNKLKCAAEKPGDPALVFVKS